MGSDAQLQAQRDMNLTLSLSANFDDVFPRPVFQTQIGKLQLQTTILVLKIFDLFNINGLHPAIFCLPVVITGFGNSGFAAHIFDGPANFD